MLITLKVQTEKNFVRSSRFEELYIIMWKKKEDGK